MYSNIPSSQSKRIITDLLIQTKINPCISADILRLLDTVLRHNYFTFNNKIFKQTFGLAMRSPLSPLLAEVFMAQYEEVILSWVLASKHVNFWYRYVGDVIICFDGTTRQFDRFLNYINSVNPRIQFTFEMEMDNRLDYLDLTIIRSADRIEFDVFRKPSATDITLAHDSLHPPGHKAAAYYALLYRALTFPLTIKRLKIELNTIFQIARSNGFNEKFVISIKNKIRKALALRSLWPGVPPEVAQTEEAQSDDSKLEQEVEQNSDPSTEGDQPTEQSGNVLFLVS